MISLIRICSVSPNLSFQAWNSRSSRERLAQLATARTAAVTSSSFILTDIQAQKAQRSWVTCEKIHRLSLNSFSSAYFQICAGFLEHVFHLSRKLFLIFMTLFFLCNNTPAIQEVSVGLSVCLCASVCLCCCCLPASISVCS